jgi:hypothetical protein
MFKRGDILLMGHPYKSCVMIVLDVDLSRPKNCYNTVNPVNGKRYRIGEDGIRKIGEASGEFLSGGGDIPLANPLADMNYEKGKNRASREAYSGDKRWEKLRDAKIGDAITVRLRGAFHNIKFQYVLERGYKFVWLGINERGKTFKYPLNIIVI